MEERVRINWEEGECIHLFRSRIICHRMSDYWYGFGRITEACMPGIAHLAGQPAFWRLLHQQFDLHKLLEQLPTLWCVPWQNNRYLQAVFKHDQACLSGFNHFNIQLIQKYLDGEVRGGASRISDKRRRLCLPLATHISEYLGDPLDLTTLNDGKGSGHVRTGLRISHLRLLELYTKILHT